MVTTLWLFASAVPSDIGGIPTSVLNGLGVVSLLMMVVGGLMSSKLYTSRQVDHMVDRYEKHLARTVENMQGRIDDAVRREGEWRDVALQFKQALQTMEGALEPMQYANATMLTIIRQMQELQRQREGQAHD